VSRMPPRRKRTLKLPAVELRQGANSRLYLFSLTGEQLFSVAEVSRVSRDGLGELIGYQRDEVRAHVQEIVDYLNSEDVVFPNSIILALSSRATFRRAPGRPDDSCPSSCGTLEIPLAGPSEEKPAWIVDGQQRALALSRSERLDLPIPVSAFVSDDVSQQRDQFVRINNTKPLPTDLLRELLPSVSGPLPAKLASQKIPSILCDRLGRDPESPFAGLIQRASTPESERKGAVVAARSVTMMIQESLLSPSGCLFTHHNMATGETDFDDAHRLLCVYWGGVRDAFGEAWGLPPSRSRLMHGAGIRAMGKLMDRVMSRVDARAAGASDHVTRELRHVEPVCRWTSGRWQELGDIPWNKVQNMTGDISLLAGLLIRTYEEGARAHA
jgi:DGQHR domain-containing protein